MEAPPTKGEEPPPAEPLKYKTWVFKVSIHCEGCKKKVKRILHNIEGVYTIDIDSKLHKVTVTGNVESDTLIKKLEKSGKHAELWPESPDRKEQKATKSKKKDKEGDPENPRGGGGEGDGARDQEKRDGGKGKAEEVVKSEGFPTAKNHGGAAEVPNPGKSTSVGKVQLMDDKSEGKKPDGEPPSLENMPVPEKTFSENDGGAAEKSGGGASGSGGKKKKKKGQNGNGKNRDESDPAAAGGGNSGPGIQSPPPAGSINPGPPIYHHLYDEFSPRYYAPPPPAYAVSYNTAYPSSSYTASYYTVAPPYSYAYSYVEPPPPSDGAFASHGSPKSFEMFNEENPNACSVM
ncbi:hypothetical protein Dimus_021698 [Dionaea muscipula]